MLQDNVKFQFYCSIERKKSNKKDMYYRKLTEKQQRYTNMLE